MVNCVAGERSKNTQKVFQIRKRRNRTIGSYMWRRIIMNTVRMILCGNVEDSRMNPSEKVGVVSVSYTHLTLPTILLV